MTEKNGKQNMTTMDKFKESTIWRNFNKIKHKTDIYLTSPAHFATRHKLQEV